MKIDKFDYEIDFEKIKTMQQHEIITAIVMIFESLDLQYRKSHLMFDTLNKYGILKKSGD